MSIDELGAIVRAERLQRRLPQDAVCSVCGAAEFLSQRRSGEVLCYGCLPTVRRRPTEEDHLAGRVYLGAVAVNLRPNDHRRVTELRIVLGMDRWPKADTSEQAAIAHFLGSLATILWLIATWLIERMEASPTGSDPPVAGR